MGKLENISKIKNRLKRQEVYKKVKADKKKLKKQQRKLRDKEVEELGEDAPPKQVSNKHVGAQDCWNTPDPLLLY